LSQIIKSLEKNIIFAMMNDKEKRIYEVLDVVVDCCSMEIDGQITLTSSDVLSKSRKANVVMTRAIFVTELLFLGFSRDTIAQVLHRTVPAIGHLLDSAHSFRITSHAYRLAEAEATIKCKKFIEG